MNRYNLGFPFHLWSPKIALWKGADGFGRQSFGAWPFFWESILDRVGFLLRVYIRLYISQLFIWVVTAPHVRGSSFPPNSWTWWTLACFFGEKRWDGSKIPRKSVVVHLFFFSATGHWNAKWIGTDHGELVEGNCDGYFDHSRDYVPSPHYIYPHYLIQSARFLCVNLNYPKRNHNSSTNKES